MSDPTSQLRGLAVWAQPLAASNIHSDLMLADCTGDETLWVFRYARYFCKVTGCELLEAIPHANAAWESWGNDPESTPEEVASADLSEIKAA